MLIIFSTQMSGIFNRLLDKEAFGFEDSARLLAQASVGDGCIYIKGFGEMNGILSEAFEGAEPFPGFPFEYTNMPYSQEDRVLLFTRTSADKEAIELAVKLQELNIPFAAVSTGVPSAEPTLVELADVHIDLNLKKGLIPNESGNRVGIPNLMTALFAYYGIKFTLEEILQEF